MIRIRPATLDDAAAIARLGERNGGGAPDIAAWKARWTEYPFAARMANVPIGWVLESEQGEIVGTFGNVPLLYEFDGRPLIVAIAADWAVDPEYRSMSMKLLTAFFKQKDVDICINGSANPTVSKVLTVMKTSEIPEPEYKCPMFWAARPVVFAGAVLRRREIPCATLLAWPAGTALYCWDRLRGAGRPRMSVPIHRAPVFDERFDAFWDRLRTGSSRLRAVRTAAVLDWRFGRGVRNGSVVILTAGAGHDITGYAVLQRRPNPEQGFEVYDVADLQTLGDDVPAIQSLIAGAIRAAREDGVAAVKFLNGNRAKVGPARALRPYTYSLGYNQLFYKVPEPGLAARVAPADVWDFAPFETY